MKREWASVKDSLALSKWEDQGEGEEGAREKGRGGVQGVGGEGGEEGVLGLVEEHDREGEKNRLKLQDGFVVVKTRVLACSKEEG